MSTAIARFTATATPGDGRLVLAWKNPPTGCRGFQVLAREHGTSVWTVNDFVAQGTTQYTVEGMVNGLLVDWQVIPLSGSPVSGTATPIAPTPTPPPPVPPTPTPSAGPLGIKGSFVLDTTRSDSFQGTSLDLSRWAYHGGAGVSKPINGDETAAYDSSLVTVANELQLAITKANHTVAGKAYSRAGSCIKSNWFWQPGTVLEFMVNELPILADGRVANWPALWASGPDWPTDVEVDLMEGLGQATATIHYGSVSSPQQQTIGSKKLTVSGPHTFSCDWRNNEFVIYYDGEPVGPAFSKSMGAPKTVILGNQGNPDLSVEVLPAVARVGAVNVWIPA